MILFESKIPTLKQEIKDHPSSLYHNPQFVDYLKSSNGQWALELIAKKYGKEWVKAFVDTLDARFGYVQGEPTDPKQFLHWYFQNKEDVKDFQEMKDDFGLQQEMSSGGGGSVQGTPGPFDDESLIREGGSNVDFILQAIRKIRDQDPNNPNRLLSIRDIRNFVSKKKPGISKEEFDAVILSFSKRGIVNLHHHDHPTGVDQETRNAMVVSPEYTDQLDGRKKRNYFIGLTLEEPPQMFEIDRNGMIEELMLREKIRKEIAQAFFDEMKNHFAALQQENIFRSAIRKLIVEKSKEQEKIPHASTGINVLEELLKSIIPTIEQDYKTLTSNPEQRESYKAHILKAVQQVLIRGDINDDAPKEKASSSPPITNEALTEWINSLAMLSDADINIGIDAPVNPEDQNEKFIDIDNDGKPDEPEEDNFGIAGQNETGRNMAEETFEKIEKQILDAYRILSDEEDQKLFFEYLLTNLKLYFEKFETEMDVSVEEPMIDPETEMNGSNPQSSSIPPEVAL